MEQPLPASRALFWRFVVALNTTYMVAGLILWTRVAESQFSHCWRAIALL